MSIEDLESIALAMVAPGKGIIAIDESTNTIKKRFEAVGIENTEESRRAYRELLLTTPGLNEHISGAILYDETIRQSTKDGVPFTQLMKKHGIIPGIKVDKGPVPLAGFPGDVVTEGLDGLRERLQEYVKLGAQFAKWRAVINISEDNPSSTAIEANCHALARYAALCQEAGLVPMVEPEVIMDGDHSIEVSYEVHEAVLRSLFNALYEQNVTAGRHHPEGQHGHSGQGLGRAGRASRKWPKPPCACSRPPCRPRCRASCSFPAARPMSSPPRISMR